MNVLRVAPLLLLGLVAPPVAAEGLLPPPDEFTIPVCVRETSTLPYQTVTVGKPCGPPVVVVETTEESLIVTVCLPRELGPSECHVYVFRCNSPYLLGERMCWRVYRDTPDPPALDP